MHAAGRSLLRRQAALPMSSTAMLAHRCLLSAHAHVIPASFSTTAASGTGGRSSGSSTDLDERVRALAAKYRPLATTILKEAIRIPADHYAVDPLCGTSGHEEPRLQYLRQQIIEHGAVERADDVWFDAFGQLVWTVSDATKSAGDDDCKVIYFDGHTDTVLPMRDAWRTKAGVDCYDGKTDELEPNLAFLQKELGYITPRTEEWDENLVFGRGSADQLSGVISQIVATKIMLELRDEGALDNVYIYSVGTVSEEDNDGGGPLFLYRNLHKTPELVPDCVVITEGTADVDKGALGIYRGQRGRTTIEVGVTGVSCHGSMPEQGKNPLEYGANIIAEAAEHARNGTNLADDAFLGAGTRTASLGTIESPSDCAVPERFTFRMDRRLTRGEDAHTAAADIDALSSVAAARAAGLEVNVRIPVYTTPSWTGVSLNNDQIYNSWTTPADHVAVKSALSAYKRVVSPAIEASEEVNQLGRGDSTNIPVEPRLDRWIFSTDGVSYPVPLDASGKSALYEWDPPTAAPDATEGWIREGDTVHPPIWGIGAGYEANCHKVGECVDTRELQHAIAVMARFPSLFAAASKEEGNEPHYNVAF